MSDPTHNKPDANERTKAIEAVQLRRSGLAYREIAAELGYADESGARRAVSRLITRHEAEAVGELRQLEGERLDALHAAHWTSALAGDVDASKIVLGIIDRRAKLFGLNAPTAVALTTGAVSDVRWAEEVAALFRELSSTPGGLAEVFREHGPSGHQIAAALDADDQTRSTEGKRAGRTLHRSPGELSPEIADDWVRS